MLTCPQCGHENPADARFCSACGAALEAAGPSREERKVVTVLFADLVGFTSRAERMDPEDVRALVSPYYAHVRQELERHGGTVEKFIGDAVMALFGAPVAHEDDPERAVRAALAIRRWIGEQEDDLHLRLAVTTGEALVSLNAQPSEGEGMASGDVVNTAARLQAAAPVDGILVDETTYHATSKAIEYLPADPVQAKGKEEPIAAWEAVEARSRFGVDTAISGRAPLIGRERELNVLVDALSRVRAERSPQLITLVGVPGIGKSRLVHELFGVVEADPELIAWRQGRSLPYGEGVSFWALAEMVKAHAGILETDTTDETGAKLRRAVGDLLEERDADWVVRHLSPLVGLEGGGEERSDHQVEAFAAWRRFFEAIADALPLVLVFEDLHWADEGLLDFVDHLVEWAGGVRLLVVCTARPELLSKRLGWGGGKPNTATLSLSPLGDEDTARLLSALLERSVLPAETQSALLHRAGGNPLYAEEFVRMMSDRELADDSELPMPESVQGIVAARLDALAEDEKALLQDAAVVGKIFWLGAVCAIGGMDERRAEEALHRLERKEFVRRERRPSVADELEYAFQHVLVRDVAYGQIPRARRAEKHRFAATWIESLGRPEDHAEMLAHHYGTALELARAAGADTASFEGQARIALREAGDRAYALSAYPAAVRFYESALTLWPREAEGHNRLLFRFAVVFNRVGREGAGERLIEARDVLLAEGDVEAAAQVEVALGERLWLQGERDRAFEALTRAEALVAGRPMSNAKIDVVSNVGRYRMLAGESEEAIRLSREALVMIEELGENDELKAHALNNIGSSRIWSGDPGGLEDIEASIALATSVNSPESVRGYGNLASILVDLGRLDRRAEMIAKAKSEGERFGVNDYVRWVTAELEWQRYWDGEWDAAAANLDDLIASFEADGFWMETPCRTLRGRLRLGRGDYDGAREDARRSLERARVSKDPQVLWPSLAFAARSSIDDDSSQSSELVFELLSDWKAQQLLLSSEWVLDAVIVLRAIGREHELLDATPRGKTATPWMDAGLAYLSGDFLAAAGIYGEIGAGPDEAYARLRAAEAFVQEGRRAEANAQLDSALAFWRAAGAAAYVREGEALLAQSA